MSKSTPLYEFDPPEEHRRHRLLWMLLGGAALWVWRRGKNREEPPVPPEDLARGHRPPNDTSAPAVAGFAVGLLILIAASFGVVALLLLLLGRSEEKPAEPGTVVAERIFEAEGPDLQSDPSMELLAVRAREDSILEGGGWIDSASGIARIPIERAMEIFAAQSSDSSAVIDSARAPIDSAQVVITESGYTTLRHRPPAPGAEPYLGPPPQQYAVNPEIARLLGVVSTKDSTRSDR